MVESGNLSELSCNLFNINVIKFGKYVLKSGLETPIYIDLRVVVSYPKIMRTVAEMMWEKAEEAKISYELLCGVPYTALPICTCISVSKDIPMLLRRKEAKSYGTKQLIEGNYRPKQKCLIIEDVVTSGTSVMETAIVLRSVGLDVTDCIVLLDREQGAKDNLAKEGINLHCVYTITTLLSTLYNYGKVGRAEVEKVQTFIENNSTTKLLPESTMKKILSPETRIGLCEHPVTKKLLQIMQKKQTNLCLAVDVTSFEDLLKFAEDIGSEICLMKTHIDILEDFSLEQVKKLQEISRRKDFLIFEDRKFADIGNTVQLQYTAGSFKIHDWADLITIHHLPGPGIIQALKQANGERKNGCLIVAEMSSDHAYTNKEYAQAAVELASKNMDFVVGFIAQSNLSEDPALLHFFPGVRMNKEDDTLDQRYISPETAIEKGADIIIVGRGITEAKDPIQAALLYRKAGYEAYLRSLAL